MHGASTVSDKQPMSVDNTKALKVRPADLPALFEDWQRVLKSQPTVNDMVESFLPSLVKNPQFLPLVNGVYDDDTVEGTMAADQLCAAIMVRAAASHDDADHPLAKKKLATIAKALNVVLKRYGFGRNQRRETVSGEFVPVPTDNGSATE